MLRPGLPEGFLQEEEALSGRDGEGRDAYDLASSSSPVPVALVLVLRNLRVFGHFENALLLELVRSVRYVSLRPGEGLFRVGDPDSSMYVVESGAVRVFCSSEQQPKQELDMKMVRLKFFLHSATLQYIFQIIFMPGPAWRGHRKPTQLPGVPRWAAGVLQDRLGARHKGVQGHQDPVRRLPGRLPQVP